MDQTNIINSFLSTNDLQASSGVDPLSFLSSLSALLGTSRPVGSIERIDISQTREIERIHSIGSYAFEPHRLVPKAIRTTLTLHKVVLYKEDFLKSVGFNSYNLYYQQAPFIIRQTLIDPTDPSGNPDVIVYFDCWVSHNPMTFDLTSSTGNLVKQAVEVQCGRVFVSSAQFIYGKLARKLTRKNIPFYK